MRHEVVEIVEIDQRRTLLNQALARSGDVGWDRAFGGQPRDADFHEDPRILHVFQRVGLAGQQVARATGSLLDQAARGGDDDTCACAVRDLDDARTRERLQCLAHRRPANTVERHQFALGRQLRVGRNLAAADALGHAGQHLPVKLAAWNRLGQRHANDLGTQPARDEGAPARAAPKNEADPI